MVEFDGVNGILAKFDKLADMGKIEQSMGKCCAVVERAAKEKAPKGATGELRRSITSKVENNSGDVTGVVFTPLEYAPYVEYGTGLFAEEGGRKDVPWHYKDERTGEWISTKGQKPQPYLRPALTESREAIVRLLKEGISND